MRLCLGKINFIIMGVAALMIIVGFIMTGGAASTPDHFNPDVFSDTRVVYGPNICFLGYILMIVGICVKGPRRQVEVTESAEENEAAEQPAEAEGAQN
ncbi:MAG: DUF3098 domain-containing protein [Bacteroidales bacterium]|nr:DUF3098 domain-containing protein [Bacteroidales bacterium]